MSDSSHDNDALADAVCAAFLLTAAEITSMSAAIYAALVAAATAAYEAAAATAGVSLPNGWELSDSILQQMADKSNASAESIAATYAADLHSKALSFLADYEGENAASALQSDLAQWAAERADWKAEQLAEYEAGVGQDIGTDQLISDVLNGEATDASGEAIDYSQLQVAILPDSSSSDFCADYAGSVYSFDEAPDIDWPAHVGCIHAAYVINALTGEEVSV